MGICVEKIVHKACGKRTLQVFQEEDGSYNGYCFACGGSKGYVKDPYENGEAPKAAAGKKTEEEVAAEVQELVNYPQGKELLARKLTREALEHFGYRFGVSQIDGQTPEVVYRPYYNDKHELLGFKAKVLDTKQTWWVKKPGDVMPFGWAQALEAGGRKLYIVEGEEDAVALWQAMRMATRGTEYESLIPSVISLSHGAGTAVKQLSRIQGTVLKNFQDVVLVFDTDKPGQDASNAVIREVFPKALVGTVPPGCKDANDAVVAGKSRALVKSVVWGASAPKNSRVVWGKELHEKAKQPAVFGVSWPWDTLTEITRGIRTGEVHYVGAGQKMGKSEIVDAIGEHLMRVHNWKILVAKPEQSNLITYKKAAGKVAGRVFHDPKVEFDEEAYDKAGEVLADRLAMINLYQHLDWKTLKEDIRAAVAEGVKAVFIDPITNLVNGESAGEANAKLQEIAQELSAMALDLDIVVFVMCHLRNPESGPEHTLGGKVLASQFAGSRAMSRSCNYMWGIEGNKDAPEEERNIRHIVLIEDREFGETGSCSLYWSRATGLFSEIKK